MHTPRASSRPAFPPHAPFEPRRDPTILLWHRPSASPLESKFSSCTICPPSLLRLRLFSILGSQVEGPDLCSTCCVHRGRCVACVANLLPKTLADLRVQILTTIGAFHLSGKMWAVREEAHSFSVTPVSCVTKRVEDIMPALQAYHARERELQCTATEVVQEPGSSPYLLFVQDCAEQCALAISDDKLQALPADQPQHFALIFSISEVPPFALLRSGSKVQDATAHIRQNVVLCQWLHLFDVAAAGFPVLKILTFIVTQHSPRLSESCASCPLLRWILRRLLVSPATSLPVLKVLASFVVPSVSDPPFSSISAANNGFASLRNVCHSTQVHTGSRGERIDLVWDDGGFAPIPLRSPFIHRFLHHQRH